MKAVVATLLLALQLQPFAGSVACLFATERADRQECEMPEQQQATANSVVQSGPATQGCALALACARTPIEVPSFANGQESIVPHQSGAASPSAVTLTSVASSPPFHPPRA